MKTRFCPSPTGHMHLGNVRTALFSAVCSKASNGQFLLRIEDTDLARSEEKYTAAIIEDLLWLGIVWQEGPGEDKENGPYFQSQRVPLYEKYYQLLIDKCFAYPCFCSEHQLVLTRKAQLASGKPPRYPGTCCSLSSQDVAKKIAEGIKPTLRFKVPLHQIIEFIDLVKGVQRFESDDIGDFIIRRADGMPSFMFCNAIDDSVMGVTHVMRGEDHLTNTPRQLMILQALGMNVPEYAHISLILGYDGSPLSKRHGSSSLDDLRQNGFLPEAIVNYLARLGHRYEENKILSFSDLADNFDVNSLSKSAAKFDSVQMMHWQKIALAAMDTQTFWSWVSPQLEQIVPESLRELFVETVAPNVVLPDDAVYWAEVLFGDLKTFDDEQIKIVRSAGKAFYEEALKALAEFGDDFSSISKRLKENLGVKGKSLFLPIRVALTGESHGPELVNIFKLLNVSELEARLNYARELC